MSIILNPTNEPNLNACPFCGEQPEYGESDDLAPAGIFCNNDLCDEMPSVWGEKNQTVEDISREWNDLEVNHGE